MMNAPLLATRNLGLPPRLAGVSLALHAGELLGLIGPNGAGKSTLLHCLAGLRDHEGECLLAGQDLRAYSPRLRAQQIGLLPQSAESAWALSVEDIVRLGRLPWNDENPAAVDAALAQTGTSALRHRCVRELSGGERARVWLARVLAGQPRVLLADEPVASLDLHYQHTILQALQAYAAGGRGVIVAIHDLTLAARYCTRLALVSEGRLVRCGAVADVLDETLLSKVFHTPIRIEHHHGTPLVISLPPAAQAQ